MKASLSWIKDYVKDLNVTDEELINTLTLTGTKAEGFERLDKNLDKIVTGKILKIEKHKDADKLVVCQVDIKEKTIQIVTGATNMKENDIVIVCLDGGKVASSHKDGKNENGFIIKKGNLRGVLSEGMMCSIEELGRTRFEFPDAPEDGIYILPKQTEIGVDAIDLLGLRDSVYDFEITSNRVDCYSVIGIAREVAASFNKEFCMPNINITKTDKKTSDFIDVKVENSNLCPRYIARVVENIKIGPSPKWLRDRLVSVGIRPINNIVDITNFVMEEYGQPMHAFDYDTLEDKKIIVKTAKKGDEFITLDSQKRILDDDTLLICDGKKPVAIAGIMGGLNSMITKNAKTLLFEAAVFNGANIRKTSKKIGLRTESSGKFEKGLDPNNALNAINRACSLIEELGCGDVVYDVVDVCSSLPEVKRIIFSENEINNILGTNISKDEQLSLLSKVELEYDSNTNEIIVPSFRQDVLNIADLAEEVARLYGYDNITSSLPKSNSVFGGLSYKLYLENRVKESARYLGYSQAMCYSFESPKVFDKLLLPNDSWYRKAINIANPLGEDFSIMRTLPLGGILTSLSLNYNHRQTNVKLYEMGNVYIPKKLPLEELPIEEMELSLAGYGFGDFFDIKGDVEDILSEVGLKNKITYDTSEPLPFLHPTRQARMIYNHTDVGYIGAVHPSVCKNFEINTDVYIAVIHMSRIQDLASFDYKYKYVPKFPALTRDLSIIIPKKMQVASLENIFDKEGGSILESYHLFDYYVGDNIEKDKKSVAYKFIFRANDRTLLDEEVNKKIEKIVSELEKIGAYLRS